MEELICFESQGAPIFGVLHVPDPSVSRGTGVVVVSSRVEFRSGPHRIFVEAARRWCEAGFHVLRLDFPGMGDSPGDQTYPHMDAFPTAPPLDALRSLQRRTEVRDVVLLGNCMGARNVLFAAREEPKVRHLVLLGMPFSNATPFYAVDQEREGARMGASVARTTLASYLKRALRPGAWRRLFAGQSEYRVMLRALGSWLGIGRGRIFEEPIYRSLRSFFARGGQALFVWGTQDVFLPDFQEEFGRVRATLPNVDSLAEIAFVEGANHTFSRVRWKAEAIDRVTTWLCREFPGRSTP